MSGQEKKPSQEKERWWQKWEAVWGRALGWEEPDPEVSDLGPRWNQWEQEWCKELDWDQTALQERRKLAEDSKRQKGSKPAEDSERKKALRPFAEDSDRQEALLLFYDMFSNAYTTSLKKIIKNKKMNTQCKRRFIHLLFWTIVVHIPLFLVFAVLAVAEVSTAHLVTIEAFVAAMLVIAALIISKDLDIQKYQETWSRHTWFQYLRDQEMLRFLLRQGLYAQEDRVDCFVQEVLKIEEQNIAKFCQNMESKEKEMLTEVNALLAKKK